jgi:hypothetical protein
MSTYENKAPVTSSDPRIVTSPSMAGGANFDITVTGKGSHGAVPKMALIRC